jgi:hypothetical protein
VDLLLKGFEVWREGEFEILKREGNVKRDGIARREMMPTMEKKSYAKDAFGSLRRGVGEFFEVKVRLQEGRVGSRWWLRSVEIVETAEACVGRGVVARIVKLRFTERSLLEGRVQHRSCAIWVLRRSVGISEASRHGVRDETLASVAANWSHLLNACCNALAIRRLSRVSEGLPTVVESKPTLRIVGNRGRICCTSASR